VTEKSKRQIQKETGRIRQEEEGRRQTSQY
jgi:hypothetical protein